MPHRTVFQWGKNHAHPFTVFLGGFVIGGLVTAAIMYSWGVVDDIDAEVETITVEPVTQSTATPSPTLTPAGEEASEVQF